MKKFPGALFFIYILFIIFSAVEIFPNLIREPGVPFVKVFSTQSDDSGLNAVVKGKILSFSVYDRIEEDDLVRQARDKTKVTVRLYDAAGIKKDDTLYVINEKNLIVSKIRVDHIFNSKSLGYLLVGRGNFTFASPEHRVVQTVVDLESQNAYIHKTKGDFYLNRGERDNAIKHYKTSLELDRGYPESHLALGSLYLEDGLHQLAYMEFYAAYKTIHRMKDNSDRYRLLKGLIEVRIYELFHSSALRAMKRVKRDELEKKYRTEALGYCREAQRINPGSGEIFYYLGKLHYVKSDAPHESDAETKNYFLKAVEADPGLDEAYIHLAILYYRNGNSKKAMDYIEQAVLASPSNARAREIKRYIGGNTK
jgi:tetratricopeptide (TPR) repeat protein